MTGNLDGWQDIMDPDYPLPLLPGDPYAPQELPIAPIHPVNVEEPEEDPEEEPEEDPEEDPEEEPEEDTEEDDPMEEEGEPFEDEEDYQPYGSDHEDDAQSEDDPPEECLTDEEIISPPPSPPRTNPLPYRNRDKGPILPTNARDADFPNIFHFTAQAGANPTGGRIQERGESSQAPHFLAPPPASFAHTARAMEQRIIELEKEQYDMHNAIQMLYHRAGASRTVAINQGIQIRKLEHELHIVKSQREHDTHRANVAETDHRRLFELHHALLRHLNQRFGV